MKVPWVGSVASCVTGYERQSPTSVVWQTHPFHAVCRRDLAEHCVVVEDRGVRGIGELGVVSGGTEVKLASGLGDRLQFHGRCGARAASTGGASRRL